MKKVFSQLERGQFATIVQSGLCKTIHRHRPTPSLFFFPGLTSKPVWNPHDIPFKHITSALQTGFQDILQEYVNLRSKVDPQDVSAALAADSSQSKHTHQSNSAIKSDYDTKNEKNKLHHGNWDWNSYLLKGVKQSQFEQSCPKTTKILESLSTFPLLMSSTPFSYAFFSTLSPKAMIDPHYGPCNLRIRCHFPLILPDGDVGMKVAGNTIRWKLGEPLFFDDSYQHEGKCVDIVHSNFSDDVSVVWNNTDKDRVVLLFDLW